MSFADIALRCLGIVLVAGAALVLALKLEWIGTGKRQEPSPAYKARARALAQAVDIAAVVRATATVQGEPQSEMQDFERREIKAKALAPEPPFASLESLAYVEDAFFTYWNEASGDHVERFWRLVAEQGLPFKRRDVVREVLNRGRINDDIEYQQVTDGLVILQQIGKITAGEANRLSMMLREFEEREVKRR